MLNSFLKVGIVIVLHSSSSTYVTTGFLTVVDTSTSVLAISLKPSTMYSRGHWSLLDGSKVSCLHLDCPALLLPLGILELLALLELLDDPFGFSLYSSTIIKEPNLPKVPGFLLCWLLLDDCELDCDCENDEYWGCD